MSLHPSSPFSGSCGLPIEQVGEVASTMTVARERVLAGLATPLMLVATSQTGGYGSHGRAWSSPVGGLWATAAWPLTARDDVADLGLRIGIACTRLVSESLSEHAERIRLKWPNDVLIDGKKVCGILCETLVHERCTWALVGIGINVNNTPPELEARSGSSRCATSLSAEAGRAFELKALTVALRDALAATLACPLNQDDLRWGAQRLWKLDEPVRLRAGDKVFEGVLRGLSQNGCPVIEGAAGRITMPPGCEWA